MVSHLQQRQHFITELNCYRLNEPTFYALAQKNFFAAVKVDWSENIGISAEWTESRNKEDAVILTINKKSIMKNITKRNIAKLKAKGRFNRC